MEITLGQSQGTLQFNETVVRIFDLEKSFEVALFLKDILKRNQLY